jgi:tetratricopeptide (TPR) repeat protein
MGVPARRRSPLGFNVALRAALPILALTIASTSIAQTPVHGTAQLTAQMQQAVAAAEHGDEQQALTLVTALLQQHPAFEPALKLQGMLLQDMGHSEEAAIPYQKALRLAPNDLELLEQVGIYHLVKGDLDEAITLFTRLLRIKPHDSDTLYYLAQAYHLKGNDDLALSTIRECVRLQPDSASVLQKYGELLCSTGDNEAALQWLLKAQHLDPTLDRLDFDLGVASYKGMHLDDAVKYSMMAADQKPNDLTVLALLAASDAKLSQWQDAEPIFQKILASTPDDTSSLLGLGHCELELHHYQASIDALNHLLQLDPTQMLAHFYLSRDYRGLGDTANAQNEADLHSRMMERASSSATPGDTARQKIVWDKARKLLQDHHEDQALQLFRTDASGPAATPGSPYVLVGAAYLYLGQDDDAVRNLKRALQIEPRVRGAHTYLGILALQQGDLNAAENEFTAELANEPNYQMAIAELGAVRYQQGRWQDAVDQISRSKTTEPSLLYVLCDAYFHLGKVKDADLTAELLSAYAKSDPEVMRGVIDLLNRNRQTELAQRLAAKGAH